MGLIVPQTVKVRTNGMTCKHYREKGYEFEKCGDFIEVNVLDLPKSSNEKVKVICDVCGKEREMRYCRVVGNNEENKLITCGDKFCKHKKLEDTCTKKYGEGIINVFQAEEVKNKIKDTNLERYGCMCVLQSEEIRNKGIQTLREKYGEGIINVSQIKEIQDKIKDTNLERYGCEYAMQNKEIQNKVKVTNLERHGVEYPTQNEEIKNKALDSFQFHGTGPSSRAQRYINHILNGTLNKRICGSLADIYMEKENIIIEHDGRGHFLGDKMNKEKGPTKESLLHEKEREDKIINNGYRMIRFIATKDRIPSDEVILNLVEGFKNSDFKVIRINFEEGTIEKDYNEKSHYDFGELRRITKEDLEQFESEKIHLILLGTVDRIM